MQNKRSIINLLPIDKKQIYTLLEGL